MFIIGKPALAEKRGFFKIKIFSENFAYRHAMLLRKYPVNDYVLQTSEWYLPEIDLQSLLLDTKNFPTTNDELKADLRIRISPQAYEHYLNWKKKASLLEAIRASEMQNEFNEILNLPLYDFQTVGAAFLYYGKNALLCDQVGLGKTIQTLAATEMAFEKDEINLAIIICPNSIKRNWVDEITKFTKHKYITVIGGAGRHQRILDYKRAARNEFIIINYDILYRDFPHIEEHIINNSNLKIAYILDEAQYIKNRDTKRSKAASLITHSENAVMRLGLSATPIENEPADLFGVFGAISRQPFGDNSNFGRFKAKYCTYDFFGKFTGFRHAEEIQKRMKPFMIRRLKTDVAKQMPQRVHNTLWVELSKEQRTFYNECEQRIVKQIHNMDKAQKIRTAEILPLIIYLRQCCLSTKLIGHPKNISTKLDLLLEYLEENSQKEKVVIFCYFTQMVDLIAEALDQAKIPNISMHGGKTKEKYRQTLTKEFDQSEHLRVLVCSDILREGINLPSASMLINFDLLWNPRKIEQRIGRIDRITNKHPILNIVNIVATNTIEENMLQTFLRKNRMNTEILDEGRLESNLSFTEIKQLFEIK